jgi:Uma2 family endonuclease
MAAHDLPPALDFERRQPSGVMTYDEFLDWCDDDTLAEWVGGEIEMSSPASLGHQELFAFLLIVLDSWVQTYDLGVIVPAPFQMHLPPPINRGREPDLLFVAQAHLARLRSTYREGPADLVIEVTSPESVHRDREIKLHEYERAGIPEYWLLDTLVREATFHELGPDGRYGAAFTGSTGVYESRVLGGLRLPVDWLWQHPLPKRIDALRGLGLLH